MLMLTCAQRWWRHHIRRYAAVVRKEDALPTIAQDAPFDIMAQIDFEIGEQLADVYYAMKGSSSDDYIVAKRKNAGKQTVAYEWPC